jgi:hypothetical protein
MQRDKLIEPLSRMTNKRNLNEVNYEQNRDVGTI